MGTGPIFVSPFSFRYLIFNIAEEGLMGQLEMGD